ncbi:MAG: efflux RND transporter periplasmic adaptor subunit [Gemmatimonadetes bacterium]|nr:efflux RND transporter periplasmic adaptor subunit [Gemmatimonadota bacterium]
MTILYGFRSLCLGVLSCAVLVASGCGDSRADSGGEAGGGRGPGGGGDGARSIPVAARVALPAELEVVLRGSANLRAREQLEVLPKQNGVVSRILVEEGAAVRAGQPLATLDNEEWRLQAQQADARARAARDASERGVALHAQGLLADQELERLRSEAAVAAADRELAQLRVRNAVIAAPISGVVTHRWVERGQLVNTATRAFAVADISRLEADVGVPERDAPRVQAGQQVRVRVEGAGIVVPGRVARVRPVVDPASGTVQVTVEVNPQQAGGLRAGQFVNIDIVTETLEERIALPRTAVLVDGAAPRVFLVEGGRAVEREVALGTSQGDQVEIQTGVTAGDTVVVVGQDNLRPGLPVRLMEVDGVAMDRQSPASAAAAPEGAAAAPGERRRQGGGGARQ